MVSVIIPTYNSELTVRRTIESVLTQTYNDYEVIVVDDGSTDNTVRYLSEYNHQLKIIHITHSGAASARNNGIMASRGNKVAFLDSDDYWKPIFLERCVNFLEENPDVDAVSSGVLGFHWWRGATFIPRNFDDYMKVMYERGSVIEDFFDFWSRFDHIRTGSVVMRRDLIKRAGLMREDLAVCEDLEYWGYLATFGKWGFIAEPLFITDSASLSGIPYLRKLYHRADSFQNINLDQWQQRIVSRLGDNEKMHFKIIKGLVATNLAVSQIHAGDVSTARKVVSEYKDVLTSGLGFILKRGHKHGLIGWYVAVLLIRFREYLKAFLMIIITKNRKDNNAEI